MTDQIRWNHLPPEPQGGERDGVTAALMINVRGDGSIHMETPPSQGGFQADYKHPQDAVKQFSSLLDDGKRAASLTTR